MDRETFQARVRILTGNGATTVRSPVGSVSMCMKWVDDNHPDYRYAEVRGEYTSSGHHWPDHGGRCVCTRDKRKWVRD
jgi:hypothetical protein